MTEPAAAVTTAVDTPVRPAWRMTATIEVAIMLGLVIATAGMLASRVDVVLIALPLLASAAIAFDTKPTADATHGVRIEVVRRLGEAELNEFAYHIAIEAPHSAEFVQLRVMPGGSPVHELFLALPAVGMVSGRVAVVHSGRQRVVDITGRFLSADGGWMSPPLPRTVVERVVEPAIVSLGSIPLPHRLTGLTGMHASARPGDGGEFRDLHPYASGDRLRRIDWKATARRSQGFGDLYVRRTDATSDATIMLVMDSREDVAERVVDWSARDTGDVRRGISWRASGTASTGASGSASLSSMDLAREAAASLAAAAIGMGDRVGLLDLASYDGVVAPGSGKRHLDRLLRRIAASGPSGIRLSRRRAPIVPAGAMVYLLSTFLDDDATSIALLWRAAGHRVIAVDVLPTPLLEDSAPFTQIAHRLVLAERRRRVADAQASGIELFRWQENATQPSRAVALRTLARAGRRRR